MNFVTCECVFYIINAIYFTSKCTKMRLNSLALLLVHVYYRKTELFDAMLTASKLTDSLAIHVARPIYKFTSTDSM